jgi:small-conductance mechanosensitive channel
MEQIAEMLVSHLLQLLDALFPARATRSIGMFTWNEVYAALVILLAAALIGAALAYALRQRSAAAAKREPAPVPHRVMISVSKPLYMIIALYAIYFALLPFVLALQAHEGIEILRAGLTVLFNLAALAALLWFGLRLTSAVETRLVQWSGKGPTRVDHLLIPLLSSCMRIALIVAAIYLAIAVLDFPDRYADTLSKLNSIVFILAAASVFVRSVRAGEQLVLGRYDITAADNLKARKVYTQLHVIGRVIYAVIAFVSVAAILMLFDQVRHIGTSILASAGIAGIIVGFAAQKTLANLFAGFQIALAQPMREDDVVIVEGEWGRVEEITLSYVVVHIWDDRRLVVPLSYFIEKPFQNWTRTSSAILGSVMVYVDYTCEVATIRKALTEIVEKDPLWDGRFWNLQVTDAKERTVELRVLATSADASKSFDLRCAIREKLIAFIQRSAPQWLPRERVALMQGASTHIE